MMTPFPNAKHPQETIRYIHGKWLEGYSSHQLSVETGVPRGTICRWAQRADWKRGDEATPRRTYGKRPKKKPAPAPEARRPQPLPAKPVLKGPPEPPAPETAIPLERWYASERAMCRWIYGDPQSGTAKCCSQPRPNGQSFCDYHQAKLFTKSQAEGVA
jgi:hypothetical protein